jgi:uncharacterized membrane protein
MTSVGERAWYRRRPSDARRAKVTLSTLWLFVVLNYLYADVTSLFDRTNLDAVLAGEVDSMQITEGFLLGAAVLMETSMVMVVLSRALPYRANRWANIASGVLNTLVAAGSLTVGHLALYYAFFAAVEIGCTVLIVGYAWRWVEPAAVRGAATTSVGPTAGAEVLA